MHIYIYIYKQTTQDIADPFLVVLCVASRGYDVQTLKWSSES